MTRPNDRPDRRHRVRLAELMAVVAGVAVCCRWPLLLSLGVPALGWYAASALTPAPARRRWFHTAALPLLWFAGGWVGWSHPGDEYGLFAVGAAPGCWVFVWLPSTDPKVLIPGVLYGGLVPLALMGRALDRAGAWRASWLALSLVLTPLLVAWLLSQFPSLERAVAKNGSVTAYVASAWNVSLYTTATLALLVTLAARAVCAAWPGRIGPGRGDRAVPKPTFAGPA